MVLAIALYAIGLSAYALLRYYDFRTLYFDLGIFSHSMSQVLHGTEGLQTLLLPSTPGHVGHFSPILVVPLVLYALLPSPATLLVFQSLLLALAALPLFELGLAVLYRTDLAVAVAVSYLLYPALQGVNRYDFHVESFVPLLAFAALLELVRGRYRAFLAVSLLLLCTHEYMSIVFLWTGGVVLAYQLLARKQTVLGLVSRGWSLTVLVLGAVFLILEETLNVLLTPSHVSVFAWLGTTTASYTGGIGELLAGAGVDLPLKALYWALLLIPLLLLPLRDWRLALPAVPWVGLTIVASNRGFYSIYSQYSALVLPFLFFAVIWGLRRSLPLPFHRLSGHRIGTVLVVAGLLATATVGPLSPLNSYDGALSNGLVPPYPPAVTAHDQGTARILRLIPSDASVLAQNELFSQLSDRAAVSPYWNVSAQGPPEYIAIDAGRTWFTLPLLPYPTPLVSLLSHLLTNDSYSVAGFSGSAFVYHLGGTAPPSLTVSAAALPSSSQTFTQNWSVVNASTAVDGTGLHLAPAPGGEGLAWTPFTSPEGVLVSCDLAWSAPTMASWSGVVLGVPGTASLQIVALYPFIGQVAYLHFVGGALVNTLLGGFALTGNRTHLEVVASGGTLQVWVGGRFVSFLEGGQEAGVASVGAGSYGENLTVTSFVAYRSVAEVPPPGGYIPWDGIDAGVLIILPVITILFIEPQPGSLVGRVVAFLRRIGRQGG